MRIRTGSSTSCAALGEINPDQRLDYWCYTRSTDGYFWTYLTNVTTGVSGWSRDDLLPRSGSTVGCPF